MNGVRLAFLDRDGTLIEPVVVDRRPRPIRSATDLVLAPGAAEGCARLRRAGFHLILVTNQPDVARGTATRSDVDAINALVVERLHLDMSLTCFHDDVDGCGCRKPLPGLLHDAALSYGVVPGRADVMIGDRWRDVEAGRAAGVRTVLIDRSYDEAIPHPPDAVVDSFDAAVVWVLESERATAS